MNKHFLTADVAELMSKAGLGCRTPHAVRSAVREGRLRPDGETPRGVKVWSLEAAMRDLERLMMREKRARFGWEPRELDGEQLALGAGE